MRSRCREQSSTRVQCRRRTVGLDAFERMYRIWRERRGTVAGVFVPDRCFSGVCDGLSAAEPARRGCRELGVMGIEAPSPSLSCVDPVMSARGCSDTASEVAVVSGSAAGSFGPEGRAPGITDKA